MTEPTESVLGFLYGVFIPMDHSDTLRMFCLLTSIERATFVAKEAHGVIVPVPIVADYREKKQ